MKIHIKTIIAFLIFGILFISSVHAQKENSDEQISNLKILEKQEWKKVIEVQQYFFDENKKDEAYKLSHMLLKTLKTDFGKSGITYLLSNYFNEKANVDSSRHYSNQLFDYTHFSSDSLMYDMHGNAYSTIAISYMNQGLTDKSKKWFIKGIEKLEKWNFNGERYYGMLMNLANVYGYTEEYEKAIKLYNKCLDYNQSSEVKVQCYLNLGNIYGSMEEFKLSNEYLYKAQTIFKKNKDYQGLIDTYINLADNLREQGFTEKSIRLCKKALILSSKYNFKYETFVIYKSIAYSLAQQKKYVESENILLSELKKAEGSDWMNEQLDLIDKLKEVYLLQKDYEAALTYSEKFFKISDSIDVLQKKEEINELEVQFETAQKEKEIELLKKDQELHESKIEKQAFVKNTILITSILIIIPILLLLYVYYQNLKTQKALNTTQQEVNKQAIISLMKDQELKLIKASIEGQDKERKRMAQDLHDTIGSNMAAIKLQLSSLSLTSSKLVSIQSQLDDTSEQIRELSHNLLPKKIRQNEFTILLEEYLKNIGEAAGITISFNVSQEKTINDTDKIVQNEIFAILQELVTNTIKHAGARKIMIQLEAAQNRIHLIYEDNGKGFDTTSAKSNGIGLKSIQNRIDELTGSFNIDPHPKRGTLVEVEIPIVFQTN